MSNLQHVVVLQKEFSSSALAVFLVEIPTSALLVHAPQLRRSLGLALLTQNSLFVPTQTLVAERSVSCRHCRVDSSRSRVSDSAMSTATDRKWSWNLAIQRWESLWMKHTYCAKAVCYTPQSGVTATPVILSLHSNSNLEPIHGL